MLVPLPCRRPLDSRRWIAQYSGHRVANRAVRGVPQGPLTWEAVFFGALRRLTS